MGVGSNIFLINASSGSSSHTDEFSASNVDIPPPLCDKEEEEEDSLLLLLDSKHDAVKLEGVRLKNKFLNFVDACRRRVGDNDNILLLPLLLVGEDDLLPFLLSLSSSSFSPSFEEEAVEVKSNLTLLVLCTRNNDNRGSLSLSLSLLFSSPPPSTDTLASSPCSALDIILLFEFVGEGASNDTPPDESVESFLFFCTDDDFRPERPLPTRFVILALLIREGDIDFDDGIIMYY